MRSTSLESKWYFVDIKRYDQKCQYYLISLYVWWRFVQHKLQTEQITLNINSISRFVRRMFGVAFLKSMIYKYDWCIYMKSCPIFLDHCVYIWYIYIYIYILSVLSILNVIYVVWNRSRYMLIQIVFWPILHATFVCEYWLRCPLTNNYVLCIFDMDYV